MKIPKGFEDKVTKEMTEESAKLLGFHKKGFRLLYDDFLEPDLFNALRDLVTNNGFIWNFRLGVVDQTKWDYSPSENYAFSHLVWYQTDGVVSPQAKELQPLIMPLFQKLEILHPLRVKFNLDIRREKHRETGYHCDCAVANTNYFLYKTAILYFNDCNGYTQFESDKAPVKSKANRLIIFDGNLKHQGVPQTDQQMRYVLNLNYIAPIVPPNGKSF